MTAATLLVVLQTMFFLGDSYSADTPGNVAFSNFTNVPPAWETVTDIAGGSPCSWIYGEIFPGQLAHMEPGDVVSFECTTFAAPGTPQYEQDLEAVQNLSVDCFLYGLTCIFMTHPLEAPFCEGTNNPHNPQFYTDAEPLWDHSWVDNRFIFSIYSRFAGPPPLAWYWGPDCVHLNETGAEIMAFGLNEVLCQPLFISCWEPMP